MSYEVILKGLEGIEKSVARRDERIEELALENRELADRLLSLEQKGAGGGAMLGGGSSRHPSLGTQFAEALARNAELFQKSGRIALELSTKAATDPVTTGQGRNIVSGAVGAIAGRALGLQYGLPRRPSPGVTAVEYSRHTGQEGNAAPQAAEGDAKAWLKPTHTLVTQSAVTVAGLTKLSKQAMSDSAALMQAVDVTLRRSLDTALDSLLVNGATGFVGGFSALATAFTSATYDTLPDAVSEAVATMQAAGFTPSVVAMTPADWLAVVVAKAAADGHYLSGSYLQPLPETLRGLRVVLSPSVAAGKALLVDTSHVELLDVDAMTIEAAYANDDFTKNLVTLRGELRVIPQLLTVGSMRLVTPAA